MNKKVDLPVSLFAIVVCIFVVIGVLGVIEHANKGPIERLKINGIEVLIEKRPLVPVELLAAIGYPEDQVKENCKFKFTVPRNIKPEIDKKFGNKTVMSYNRTERPGAITIIYCRDRSEVESFLWEVLK
jgi:hypothetical protein